jgi:hypothetical protein
MYSVTTESGGCSVVPISYACSLIMMVSLLAVKNLKMGIPYSGMMLITSFMKICQMVQNINGTDIPTD